MAEMEFHPASGIFPLLEGAEFEALADDIERNGLQIPVETLDGQIIDGRNRYRACIKKDIEPDILEVEAEDPIAYVLSMNLYRRHLDESQRTMVGSRVREFYAKRAKERQKTSTGGGNPQLVENLPQADRGRARDQAGAVVNVSGRSIDHGSTVLDKGSSALVAAVDSGKIPVSSAAKLVDLPKSEQTRIAKSENPKAEARKARPDWAKGPTPSEQADASPERRWHATLHKLYVFMNSTRDLGGIGSLVKKWSDDGRKEYVAELKRIIGELRKWITILEGRK